MKTNQKLTLVMYPNTHGVGFVICEGPDEIIDFGLKKVRSISNSKYLKKAKWLMEYCRPNLVLLLDYKNGSQRISKRQEKVIDSFRDLAKAQLIPIQTYSRSQVKQVFSAFEKATKYEIAMQILGWYPQLKNKEPHKRLPWMAEHYQMGVFDAFALMLTHYYLRN